VLFPERYPLAGRRARPHRTLTGRRRVGQGPHPVKRLLLPLILLATPACTYFSSREQVLVSSEPLGARIVVDGHDTGQTTPASLPLGGLFGGDHTIVLHKPGYRPAVRRVCQYTEGYTSKWVDGAYDIAMPA